ncbi:phosphotransferase family protein [Rhizobium wuzhouense]|uniref:Choline kinase n=1 Tax=Rhizobium wuzhouense TaxID=1986026 RepID=A0ABX5NTX8_9HYPH|nr:phosphotransferase family protein [Rhizobium wuzhouense]PYB71906.1 choline kinase [Rhizobium wuzhouense]
MTSIDRRTEDRIHRLSCWNGSISIEALHGGLSNESYLVSDASGRHVVRLGVDYPFHHVSRDRETMTARAAHAAGFAPKVEHSEPGIMVTQFLTAQTLTGADIATRSDQIALMLKRFHQEMPHHVTGPGFMFWPFHVVRDYARTLDAGNSRMRAELPRYLSLAAELEATQAPLPIVFGHNDLLPSNILDDGVRLWLIDFEYAGFSTAMFDLAGATSNAGLSPDQSEAFFNAYLGSEPSAELGRAMAAMQCASLLREAMWSMVSELYLDAPGADYVGYTADNLKRLDEALDHYHSIYGKQTS